jgi:hypothetical protein
MCPLSNASGLADQLVMSQEDSVRKRGNAGGKVMKFSAQPYFIGHFSHTWWTWFPMSEFGDLGVARKLAFPSF